MTGDVDAYMLYKETGSPLEDEASAAAELVAEEETMETESL